MVLSNKKLKQKLRAAKAALIVESEARNNLTNKDVENFRTLDSPSDSLKKILNTESREPTLSKREKRRQKLQENSDVLKHIEIDGVQNREKDCELKSDDKGVKKKEKRKRDENEVLRDVEDNKAKKLKKKKRDENEVLRDVEDNKAKILKKKKKNKKKKKPMKLGNGLVKEDGFVKNTSEASRELLKAEADEGIKRQEVEVAAKVYVGGIPYYSTEDDIRSYFEGCGSIVNVDCMEFPDTRKFRGIAIITFKTEAAAKRALALDGSDMGGLFLTIQSFKSSRYSKLSNFSPSVLEGYNRIYVGNLSWDTTENDLRELFADCSVTSVRFGEDKVTKDFKGYAHVEFADSLSLHIALKLDQNLVCGRPVRISCALWKNETADNSTPMAKESKADSHEVSVVSESNNKINESKTDSSEVTIVSSKIRRRTCYECGERGHLLSSCPKKQATDVVLT